MEASGVDWREAADVEASLEIWEDAMALVVVAVGGGGEWDIL